LLGPLARWASCPLPVPRPRGPVPVGEVYSAPRQSLKSDCVGQDSNPVVGGDASPRGPVKIGFLTHRTIFLAPRFRSLYSEAVCSVNLEGLTWLGPSRSCC